MLIKRNVYFSQIDENGEERLFSTTEKRTKLSDVSSHRGLGRSAFIGGTGGAIGGYLSKGVADDADEAGKSDAEIKEAAVKHGRKAGAIAGGLLGAKKNVEARLKRRREIDGNRNR